MHYSLRTSQILRSLGEHGALLRRTIEGLKTNLYPDEARPIPERAGWYEIKVGAHWVIYRIDDSGMETVVFVTVVQD